MFNIYEEKQEEFSENATTRELFKRGQHPQLQDTVKALKVCFDMEGLTYTQAANHLAAAVSEFPEFHSTHRVAAARIHGGSADTGTHNKYNNSTRKGAPKSGIRTADGKIFTGFYKHWWTLTDDEKQHVIEERKCKGNKKGTGGTKNNKRHVEELGSLQEQLHEMKLVMLELLTYHNMMQAMHFAGDKARQTRRNENYPSRLDSYLQPCYMFISFANRSFGEGLRATYIK